MRLRVEGEGDAGDHGGPSGDLYVAIRVKAHKYFSRENDHLYCQATISFPRAAMGTKVEIPTFEGRERRLEVHVLGRSGMMYGKVMRVYFERFLRPERSFPSAEELARQISEDVRAAKEYFRRKK